MMEDFEPIEIPLGGLALPFGTTIHQWPPPIHPDRAILTEVADIFSRPRSKIVNGHAVEYFDMEPGLSKKIEDQLREIATRIPHGWPQ